MSIHNVVNGDENIITTTQNNEPSDDEFASLDDLQHSESPVEDKTAEEPKEEKPEVKVPDKFKGKSMEEILESYTKLEQAYGRQSNEFGELRKLTDEYVLKGLKSGNEQHGEHIEEEDVSVAFDDIVEDPTSAVGKLVKKELKGVTDKLDAIEKEKRFSKFESKRPTWKDDLADTTFQEWVTGSKYRTELFRKADQFDIDAADELWDAWAERKEWLQSRAETESQIQKAEQETALKKATTESSSTGMSSRKYLRRADIIKLRVEDPDRYEAMGDEIRKAYEEGRVK